MAYKQFRNDLYIKEIQQKLKNISVEQPIIDKYYSEFRAKLKPTIEETTKDANSNQIRNIIINELSPILKNQTSNFIETLSNSNDLIAFYKFGPAFLNQVKDIRDLDSSFLIALWNKYKSKILTNDFEEEEKYAVPIAQEIIAPFGIAPSGMPHAKRGRKPKESTRPATSTKISYIEQLKNSSQFKARQISEEIPVLSLEGHGIRKMHHHTLKKTIGRGIVGETYVSRR